MQTTSADSSLWLATAPATDFSTLRGTVHADVAIIGGGITGLTTALLLHRAGVRVAVLEAGRVGHGVTGCTTAKVTALQGTVYSTIRSRHGRAAAAVYAEASLAAVEQVDRIAEVEAIDCSPERRAAYTYAADTAERRSVEREASCAEQAGLPVAFVEDADLPYSTHGAVVLAEQLQLHPVRYVQGIAAALGDAVFENSRVLDVAEGSPCRVVTAEGEVRADHVVVATHYPILDRGLYFARLEAQRSYCVAARLSSGAPPQGMSISAGSPTRSVRSYGDMVVIGGEGHAVGATSARPDRYARLESFAREHWPVAEIAHCWSAQDPSHYDKLPVIGRYRPGSSRLWVGSGFMKWGLSSGTFAAMIISDGILGRPNPWADTFTPMRLSPRSTPDVAKLGLKFGTDLVGDRLRGVSPASSEIPAGSARVVGSRSDRVGVYRDEDGKLHGVSVRCTHLGCLLRFNSAERSWDCPCHGSRFDVDGEVLEGPAVHPLQRRDPP